MLWDSCEGLLAPILIPTRMYGSDGSTATQPGAAYAKGGTPGTHLGAAVVMNSSTVADFMGVAEEAVTSFGTVAAGSIMTESNFIPLIINRDAYYRAYYDRDSAISVTSTSTDTLTITSLEDNIDGATFYNTTDKQTAFVKASASGSCTTYYNTGWTSADSVIKILPENHLLGVLDTNGDTLNTTAAVGTQTIRVLSNFIQFHGHAERLSFGLHEQQTYSEHPEFFSKIQFRDHICDAAV